jgi:hypothetical protein
MATSKKQAARLMPKWTSSQGGAQAVGYPTTEDIEDLNVRSPPAARWKKLTKRADPRMPLIKRYRTASSATPKPSTTYREASHLIRQGVEVKVRIASGDDITNHVPTQVIAEQGGGAMPQPARGLPGFEQTLAAFRRAWPGRWNGCAR